MGVEVGEVVDGKEVGVRDTEAGELGEAFCELQEGCISIIYKSEEGGTEGDVQRISGLGL